MNKVQNFAMFVLIRRVLCQLWNKKSVSLTQYITGTQHQQTWLEKSACLFQNLKFLKRGLIGLGAKYQTYNIILKQWRWAIYRVMKQETARVSYILCLRNPTYNLNCKNSYNPSVYLTFNSPKVSGDKRTFTEKSSIMIFRPLLSFVNFWLRHKLAREFSEQRSHWSQVLNTSHARFVQSYDTCST